LLTVEHEYADAEHEYLNAGHVRTTPGWIPPRHCVTRHWLETGRLEELTVFVVLAALFVGAEHLDASVSSAGC
jgi:hypothetical protein